MGTRVRRLDLTVIMPVAPGANPKPAIKAVERSIPKGVTAELITVTGRHPTRQRNLAAHRARGRILWFLDHDAVATPGACSALLAEFRHSRTAVAGGPNLAARPRNAFEASAGEAIASRWGSPFVTDRYRSVGGPRAASERSLILCNLMVRREAFIAAGGFDPRLYPNEENDLLNRLSGEGRGLRHVPAATVVKSRPATWAALVREAFRYGRGRARQVWIGSATAAPAGRADGAPRAIAGVLPGMARIAAWLAGVAAGLAVEWRSRSIRLDPLPVDFSRFTATGGRFRPIESFSCDLGSLTMKGAFRHA
jgi:hypothetical protein